MRTMEEIDVSDFERKIRVRRWSDTDFEQIVQMQGLCFPKMETWSQEQFEDMRRAFPDGQLCVEFEGRVVASSSSLIVEYDLYSEWHDWRSVSNSGHIGNHDDNGDVLYGIEIMVHPEFRGMKLARRLYDARKALVRERNLKGIVIGGRIPNYIHHQSEMTAFEYVQKVEDKSIYDPVLTTQLSNGFELKRLMPDYLPSDEDSAGWATHMEWLNLDFRPFKNRSIRPVQMVRIAAVQYMMRPISSWEEFRKQVTFFVETASDYRADFVVLPELITTQLLSLCTTRRPAESARALAEYTPQYLEAFADMAVRFHVNIIPGSTFVLEDNTLYNVAYLFRRDGTIGKQYKLHITSAEWKWWGITGGDHLEVFNTDCGRIAILICYDVEFPELARIAAKKGAQILCVPFNTNERFGYLRVRRCAMARCVENHMYAVLSGATGNLPFVANADVHYAQSGIYTPADIHFSRDGIAAECTPNIETVVIQDLDVELLRRHRYVGTTTNWNDRRHDLYEVHWREGDKEDQV